MERRVPEVPPATFAVGATTLLIAAAIGIAYWFERDYRRWQKENHPFAGSFARVEQMGATYRDRRADLSEVGQVIAEIVRLL